MSQDVLERLWRRRAAALSRRLNFGWWLERFNALVFAGLLVFASVLLAARTWRPESAAPLVIGGVLAAFLAVLALAAYWLGRKHFVAAEAGLIRLDDRLCLNNRLVSAAARVGAWPEFNAGGRGPADLRWNVGRSILPLLAALAIVAAAWWVPIPERASKPPTVVEPGAWEQMEDWLATLEDSGVVEEETIEELEGRIEEFRDQPEDEWFSHSSLEATDSLQDSLGMQIRDLAAGMNTLERDLSALKNFSAEMSEEAREQVQKEMQEALEALEGGGLPLDKALLKQLKEIDPAQLGKDTLSGMTPEQREALQEQLREGSKSLGSMEGLPELGEGQGMSGKPGFGEGEGEQPGKGGVTRGRGDAPLFFGDKEDDLGTTKLERVENEDFSKASVGEVLGIGETERELDKTATGPAAGGAVGSTGRGGEAVSRETLLPDEQAVLKRYFK
jgi:hypothetical protein